MVKFTAESAPKPTEVRALKPTANPTLRRAEIGSTQQAKAGGGGGGNDAVSRSVETQQGEFGVTKQAPNQLANRAGALERGGYLFVVSETPVPNAFQITVRVMK
jgi:hypothetical protein